MCFKACQYILLHQIHKIMIIKKASYDPFQIAMVTNILFTFVHLAGTFIQKDISDFSQNQSYSYALICVLES